MKIKYMIFALVLAGTLSAMEPSEASQPGFAPSVKSAWRKAISKRVSFDVAEEGKEDMNDLVVQSVTNTPKSSKKSSQQSSLGLVETSQQAWFQDPRLLSKKPTARYLAPVNSSVADEKDTANAEQIVTFTIPEQLATAAPRRLKQVSNFHSRRNTSTAAVAGDPMSPPVLTPVPTHVTIIVQSQPCCTIL